MMKSRLIVPVIFFSSFSGLAYEILLTRIFSISLWYHFAFMIISIAMLGIGAGGTILALYPRLRSISNIGMYSLFFGTSICLGYLSANLIPFDPVRLSWSRLEILNAGLYYIVLSVPFFFWGLTVAAAYSSLSEKAGLIYGADLLGAGAGSLGALWLMSYAAPENGVFILSSIILSMAFMISRAKMKFIAFVLISVNLLLLFIRPWFAAPRMSPYKELQTALRYPGAGLLKTYFSPFSRIDVFNSPAVRFAPGLSLGYLDALPEQTGIAIDGGEMNAITAFKEAMEGPFLDYLPSALPYLVGYSEDVLIIDPRGGLQVIMAGRFSSKNIYKVESNPLLLKIVRDDYRDFSGDIFGKNTWPGLGRTWLMSRQTRFDVIDISLMGAGPSGPLGIAEDYRFTVEAFREYISHLKPSGLLSINLYIVPPPRTELRLLSTIISALDTLGVSNAADRIAAIRSWGSICILVKGGAFTKKEVDAIKGFAKERMFDLIHHPGVMEEDTNIHIHMPSNDYYTAFKRILDPGAKEEFLDRYIFDVRPVTDDRPFFHYYLKLENIGVVYKMMGGKWQYFIEEGYLLPVLFIQVLILSCVLMLMPALKAGSSAGRSVGAARRFLPYFAFLGIGFMFVEMSFIQNVILFLENPSYAVAALLTSILISSGIGGLLANSTEALRRPGVMPAISFLVILYSIFLPDLTGWISIYPMSQKIVYVFFIFMPLGILMGIPFPSGLRLLGLWDESYIPWAWAINGCFSVLSPVLAVLLAIMTGFKMVLWIGAAAYMAAFIILSFLSHLPSAQRPQGPSG